MTSIFVNKRLRFEFIPFLIVFGAIPGFAQGTQEKADIYLSLKREILGKSKRSTDPFQKVLQQKMKAHSVRKFERQLGYTKGNLIQSLTALPDDMMRLVLSYSNGPSFSQANCAFYRFAKHSQNPKVQKQIAENKGREKLNQLLDAMGKVITIPKGLLPDKSVVETFETSPYPVTRGVWMEVMGKIPENVPAAERDTWAQCKKCPVNYVNYEKSDFTPGEVQDFFAALNLRTLDTHCTYRLPNNRELHYMLNGDATGTHTDLYAKGVTAENVSEYITHEGNSNGAIRIVGLMKPNDFGVELGNVGRISSEMFDPGNPSLGRAVYGTNWTEDLALAKAGERQLAVAGGYHSFLGFSYVRTCRDPSLERQEVNEVGN